MRLFALVFNKHSDMFILSYSMDKKQGRPEDLAQPLKAVCSETNVVKKTALASFSLTLQVAYKSLFTRVLLPIKV